MWKNEQISEIFYEGEVNQGGYWLSIERVYRLLSGIMFMKAMWKIYQNK